MINKTAQNKHLVILTASSGLGSFIPAVTLSHYLQSIGYSVELCCIEQLYHAKAIVQFNQTRDLCARDMRAAKLAQQLINDARTDILLAIDQNRWQELLHRWQHQQCKKFIIFSGFWLPLLAELASKTEHAISFDAIHMDATHSSSWKHCDSLLACRHIWLFNADTQEVSALTPVTKVKTWQHRSAIVACHGGGWNIGNVKSPLQTLFQHEISTLSYVTQPPNDVINKLQHFIKIQANWQPWMQGCQDGGKFPPHSLYTDEANIESSGDSHFFKQQLDSCRGIVTKPGGGSLLDSITTVTPLILLPAYGTYEQANGDLWLNKGFAITFEQWQQHQFDWRVLQKLHENLLAHHQLLAKEKFHYAP